MANYNLGGERPRENRQTFDRAVAGTHNTERLAPHPEPLLSLLLPPRA